MAACPKPGGRRRPPARRRLEIADPEAVSLLRVNRGMDPMRQRSKTLLSRTLIASATLLATLFGGLSPALTGAPVCSLGKDDRRRVVKVLDGETLVLDDRRKVRLIGALAPNRMDVAAEVAAWPAAKTAKSALERLVLDTDVLLTYARQRNTDVWGRLLAHVYVLKGTRTIWVQGALLAGGHARAYAIIGHTKCIDGLVHAEGLARKAKAGLWAKAPYQPVDARKRNAIDRLAGTFQVVEGRVASVSVMRTRAYINFGPSRKRDLTATLGSRALRAARRNSTDLKALAGRRIRIRGWLEHRRGPVIDLATPDLIEVISEPKLETPIPPSQPGVIDASSTPQ